MFEVAADAYDSYMDRCSEHTSFDDWWKPFTYGVGPAGAYLAALGPEAQIVLRERCSSRLFGRGRDRHGSRRGSTQLRVFEVRAPSVDDLAARLPSGPATTPRVHFRALISMLERVRAA